MDRIYHYCPGESHKSTDKPCQDCAWAESNDSLSMAIVCDGHGGESYFRSQYGAKFAVDITKLAVRSFVENMGVSSYTEKGQESVFTNKYDLRISIKAEKFVIRQIIMFCFNILFSNNPSRDVFIRPFARSSI